MCHKLDQRFFDELGGMDPSEVVRRTLADYGDGRYRLTAWGEEWEVDPRAGEIRPLRPGAAPADVEVGLSIIFHLLRAQDLPLKGEWVSEKDLPGGVAFFRGPHVMPSERIERCFGEDLARFRSRCEALGGTPLEMADGAYWFKLLPRVPVAVLFWAADEEFGAQAKFLFDRTAGSHLPLDVIFGIGDELGRRLCAQVSVPAG